MTKFRGVRMWGARTPGRKGQGKRRRERPTGLRDYRTLGRKMIRGKRERKEKNRELPRQGSRGTTFGAITRQKGEMKRKGERPGQGSGGIVLGALIQASAAALAWEPRMITEFEKYVRTAGSSISCSAALGSQNAYNAKCVYCVMCMLCVVCCMWYCML